MANKINETNVIVSKTDYKSDQGLAQTARKNKDNLVAVDDAKVKKMVDQNMGASTTSVSNSTSPTTSSIGMYEQDAIIEPQDQATIKYLSNVKDSSTGEVSKPFTIDGKNYQMIRGKLPSKEVVMAVYCHDDLLPTGENRIYSVEDFDAKIATPMKERALMQEKAQEDQMKAEQEAKMAEGEKQKEDEFNFEGYKHYLVNRKTNEIRKFKSIKELIAQPKLEEEDYMGMREFKQHMNTRMFGGRKRVSESIIITKNELIKSLRNNE